MVMLLGRRAAAPCVATHYHWYGSPLAAPPMQHKCRIKPGITRNAHPTTTTKNHTTPLMTCPLYIWPRPGMRKLRRAATPRLHRLVRPPDTTFVFVMLMTG